MYIIEKISLKMRNIILFESSELHADMLPLSYTRPVGSFRIGILTLTQKWERVLNGKVSWILPVEELQTLYPVVIEDDNIFINSMLLPDDSVVEKILSLKVGESIYKEDGELLALRGSFADYKNFKAADEPYKDATVINYVYDLFLNNAKQIEYDFSILTSGRKSAPLSDTCLLLGSADQLFIEKDVEMEGVTLNTKEGPIYIGEGVEVMEDSCLRGPLAISAHSQIKIGAKIYGGTTIGPYCKVGGEVINTIFFGYSNKAHDGFVGNAVIGKWCNIGAGVNASNLKNDYAKIRVWNYRKRSFMRTNLQFCGLIMGDHSRIGINCMLNTATVMGVCVNLHGAGFPRPFIPSFSQGSPAGGFTDIPQNKFYEMAERMMSRRGETLTDNDKRLFENIRKSADEFK